MFFIHPPQDVGSLTRYTDQLLRILIIDKGRLQGKGNQVLRAAVTCPRLAIPVSVDSIT
jgi:hypothetical protein